jgi:hypothetical protein
MTTALSRAKNVLLLLVVLAALLAPSAALSSEEGAATFYNTGNAAFLSGDFPKAVENFLKARDQGTDDPRLFYNLGCAYLKSGKIGESIRYFEMARTRDPRDEDTRVNLEFARSQILDELPDTDKSLIVLIGSYPLRNLSSNELVFGACAAFILSVVLIGAAWPRRRERTGLGVIIVGLCLLGASLVIAGYAVVQHVEFGGPRSVIGVKELQVKSGPGLDNPTLFTVHEGLESKIREVRGTWSFIEIPTGFTGWVPNEALLPIG